MPASYKCLNIVFRFMVIYVCCYILEVAVCDYLSSRIKIFLILRVEGLWVEGFVDRGVCWSKGCESRVVGRGCQGVICSNII